MARSFTAARLSDVSRPAAGFRMVRQEAIMKFAAVAAVALLAAPAVSAQTGTPFAQALARESARPARATINQSPSVFPGWSKVLDIEPGTRISVTTRSAGVATGTFLGADRFAITMNRGTHIEQTPVSDVIEVKTIMRPIGRGAGLGAAVGGGIVLAAAMLTGGDAGFGILVRMAPGMTGLGLGIGAAFGSQVSTRVVYRAP
jgi:hypothetical protein